MTPRAGVADPRAAPALTPSILRGDPVALLWTSPADVRDRWVGDTLPATDEQLETLLGDAEDTILREYPTMQTRVDEGTTPILRVRKVASRMVMRHLRNPAGTRTLQRGAGPFSESTTYGGDEPGSVYLTDEDRAELGGARSGQAFTIDTAGLLSGGREWLTPDTWRPVA